jgi:TonB family protein
LKRFLRRLPLWPVAILGLAALLGPPRRASAYEGAVQRREPPQPAKAPTLTRAPELKRFVEAAYPDEALKEGLTGEVGLIVDIAADGSVAAAEVVRPAGHGFDEAALAAVRAFVFTPAELDGSPAAVRIEYTYRFVLREAPKAPPPPGEPPPPEAVTLHGRALERGTRAPIPGASVTCLERPEEVTTGPRGEFALHPPPGPCTLRVSAFNHEPFERRETIVQGKVLEVSCFLMPKAYGLYQSIVRGDRDKREATSHELEREELLKVPGSMGDPVRALQNLPGIARMPYLGGQLVIRGAYPNQTGAYMDGVEIPLLFHFLGGPSVVNPEFLDALDFYPGGFGPRYGRAIGGIVNARTRRGGEEDLHGSFKVDLIDSAAFVEAPLSTKLSVAASARRSYIDALLPSAIPNGGDGTISILPRYWDYQVRADYGKRGERHQLTLMAFGSDDRLSVASSGSQRQRDFSLATHTGFHRARLTWTFHQGALTNTFSPYVGRDEMAAEMGDGASTLGGSSVTPSAGLRDELTWSLPGNHALRVGADFQVAEARYAYTAPPLTPYRSFPGADPIAAFESVQRNLGSIDWGLYAELEARLGPLTLLPGVRLDLFRLQGASKTSADPRLTARWKLDDKTAIKGAVGRFSQAPSPFQFDPVFGNPTLLLQKALQTSLGVERRITDALHLDVTAFFNRRYDLVASSSEFRVNAQGERVPEIYNNDGLGRSYGLEVLLRHEITEHLFGWIAYTFSRSEERLRNEPYHLGTYDEPHILTLVAQYRFGNGWELGGRFRLVSGRPTTPIATSVFDADTGRYQSVTGEIRSQRLSTFNQLDLRVDKSILFERWKLGVYLDVQNVYWAKNPEGYQWDYRYRQQAQIPGLPILPTLGVKGSF